MDTWSDAEETEELSPSSSCPICKGAGFVHPPLPLGKPDFSRVVACRCTQQELDKGRQTHLLRYSNLGSLTRFTFDNLLPKGRSGNPINQEQFNRIYEAAKAFATEPKGWLILVGPSGCGKTHLAAAIANERVSQGRPAFFSSTPDLLDRLRSAFNTSSEIPYDEFFDQVRNAPLLVLDDLGAQTSTPWVKEKLDQLLNYRFNSELPTVIVAIIPIEQLEDRIRTRLTDPNLCHIYAVEEKQALLEYSWGPEFELQKSMTFDNFDWRRVNLLPEQRQNLEQAFRLALDFAKSPEGWLVFMGVTGCLLVKVGGNEAITNVDLEAPLLIMDDFGEQSTTPWAREKLYQVINYRYNARLATVITTRYSLQEILEEIEASVSSRLVDIKISTPFNIIAPDYRGDLRSSQKKTPRTGRKGRWS
ncbi:hypothetical protein ES705_20974 [subsurface metagenome]